MRENVLINEHKGTAAQDGKAGGGGTSLKARNAIKSVAD